ncbi:MAG TPA: adenylate/guanylate cyclase domain-containing protein [Solirubrobacteraceae bacterium]|nr:adenylate/guanylate cyclase domain-containing protein [Solirubrobacteraceae bacterium]
MTADRVTRTSAARQFDAYVPDVLLAHVAESPEAQRRTLDATLLFSDVSGFTKLSERLARRGREGAEEMVDTIDDVFTGLLSVAHARGGSMVKLAGDALLLLFSGPDHVARAAATALEMRSRLRIIGAIPNRAGSVPLRMSQGLHSGEFHLFLVGESHRELLIVGPAATTMAKMEKAAGPGQVVISPEAAARLPLASVGAAKGGGHLLVAPPPVDDWNAARLPRLPDEQAIAMCLSTEVRRHIVGGKPASEHRQVTAAFVRFEGIDTLIEREGADAAAAALHELVADVQHAADEQQVCFLESDTDVDGGKIMLTAGAPRIVGDDEDRLLLALRRIVDGDRRLPVRVGVNRGNTFCADLGPAARRSYSVMGDTVNLAARVTARASPGEIYATRAALDRVVTPFQLTDIAPFAVKGKRAPVHASRVGPALPGRVPNDPVAPSPLVGRTIELHRLRQAREFALSGTTQAVEIVGEAGIGKSRLLAEIRAAAGEFTRIHAVCEAYTASTPYAAWQQLLRPLIGLQADASDDAVLVRLQATVDEQDPELRQWLPLLALPFGTEAATTVEVGQLAPEFRLQKLREILERFLRKRMNSPTLLEIEDVHLMDAASAELLTAILVEVGDQPWLFVVTRREGATGLRLPDNGTLITLQLDGLARHELLRLAEAATDAAPLPPHVLERAVDRCGGNPQFLRALLRVLATDRDAPLPDSIETAAMAQIDRLAPADRALLRRAAVLGVGFDPSYLTDMLDDGVSPPDEATWERLSHMLVDVGDGTMRFRRDVIRDSAYAGLPFRERRRLHEAVGLRLEQEAGETRERLAETLSLHFARAGDDARTWTYARLAADRARNRLAPVAAASFYRLAADAGHAIDRPVAEIVAVLVDFADAQVAIGELDAAAGTLRSARRLITSDPVTSAVLLLRHARISDRVGHVRSAVRWASRALRALDDADPPSAAGEHRARTLSMLAGIRQREGRTKQAMELCRRAIAEAEAAGEERALAHAYIVLDWGLYASGRPQEAVYAPLALEIYTRLGELLRQSVVLNNLGANAYFDGRWDDAVSLYEQAAKASAKAGNVADAAIYDCNTAEVLSDQGRLDEAAPRLQRARRTLLGSGHEIGAAFATALYGRLAVRAGRHAEGLELLHEALAVCRRLRVPVDAALVEAYLAEAHLFGGQPAATLEAVARLLPTSEQTAPLLHRVRGIALAQLGDDDGAEMALEAALAAAEEQGSDFEVAVTLDVLIRIRGADDPRRQTDVDRCAERRQRLHVVTLHTPPLAIDTPPGELLAATP